MTTYLYFSVVGKLREFLSILTRDKKVRNKDTVILLWRMDC